MFGLKLDVPTKIFGWGVLIYVEIAGRIHSTKVTAEFRFVKFSVWT